jgi:hypothetical protein
MQISKRPSLQAFSRLETEGSAGILGIGLASGAVGLDRLQQQDSAPVAATEEDPFAKLTRFKKMLDAGLIEQSEYDAVKAKILDL